MGLEVPSGGIIIWSGAIPNIPFGFVLCDGNNGSPDLRDKFVIGAGTTYTPGQTGGNITHSHSFDTDGHSHEIPAGAEIAAGTDYTAGTEIETDTGTTDPATSMPFWYALAYIMKT